MISGKHGTRAFNQATSSNLVLKHLETRLTSYPFLERLVASTFLFWKLKSPTRSSISEPTKFAARVPLISANANVIEGHKKNHRTWGPAHFLCIYHHVSLFQCFHDLDLHLTHDCWHLSFNFRHVTPFHLSTDCQWSLFPRESLSLHCMVGLSAQEKKHRSLWSQTRASRKLINIMKFYNIFNGWIKRTVYRKPCSVNSHKPWVFPAKQRTCWQCWKCLEECFVVWYCKPFMNRCNVYI